MINDYRINEAGTSRLSEKAVFKIKEVFEDNSSFLDK
jgi:hypothetical protein